MTEEQRQLLIAASTRNFELQERFRNLSMQNMQTDPDKRRQQAIDYDLACAEAVEAKRDLDNLIKGIKND